MLKLMFDGWFSFAVQQKLRTLVAQSYTCDVHKLISITVEVWIGLLLKHLLCASIFWFDGLAGCDPVGRL